MPAIIAAVCPKLRRKFTSFTRGSAAASASRMAAPPSLLPSFTNTISNGRPRGSSAASRRLCSSAMLPSSL